MRRPHSAVPPTKFESFSVRMASKGSDKQTTQNILPSECPRAREGSRYILCGEILKHSFSARERETVPLRGSSKYVNVVTSPIITGFDRWSALLRARSSAWRSVCTVVAPEPRVEAADSVEHERKLACG